MILMRETTPIAILRLTVAAGASTPSTRNSTRVSPSSGLMWMSEAPCCDGLGDDRVHELDDRRVAVGLVDEQVGLARRPRLPRRRCPRSTRPCARAALSSRLRSSTDAAAGRTRRPVIIADVVDRQHVGRVGHRQQQRAVVGEADGHRLVALGGLGAEQVDGAHVEVEGARGRRSPGRSARPRRARAGRGAARPRSTSTRPVGRPCARAVATASSTVSRSANPRSTTTSPIIRVERPGGAAGRARCWLRSRGRPLAALGARRSGWRRGVAHHRVIGSRRTGSTSSPLRYRQIAGAPGRGVARGSLSRRARLSAGGLRRRAVLERALDLRVERVEPVQRERLGRGEALAREPRRRRGGASRSARARAGARRRASRGACAAITRRPSSTCPSMRALVAALDLRAVGELARLAEVVHDRRAQQQVAVQPRVQRAQLERQRGDRDGVLEQAAEVGVVAAAAERAAAGLCARRGAGSEQGARRSARAARGRRAAARSSASQAGVVDLAREVLEEASSSSRSR